MNARGSTIKKLQVMYSSGPEETVPVGTLAEQGQRIFFEYASSWLARQLELSPFTLPAREGLMEHSDRQFGPLFGLFDDSLPDGWGLMLMDRHFRTLGVDPATVSPLDRLSYLGTRTMGALTYHPPADREEAAASIFDLHLLSNQALDVQRGKAAEVLPQLLNAGGSPGGARPKVLVGFNVDSGQVISGEDDLPVDFEHWMVKFSAQHDADEAGSVEYAYSLMARAAGLVMPETRLFETPEGDRFYGVRRFDRAPGNHRCHLHTFGNLIHANFRIPCCDYAELLKVTRILTRDHHQVLRAFRLMTFNVLAHNRDDHAKNFAFSLALDTGRWSLSPAYDLTHASGPGGEHTTSVDGEGKSPAARHVMRLARPAGIEPKVARQVIDEVHQAVSRWPEFARLAQVSSEPASQIAARLRDTEVAFRSPA